MMKAIITHNEAEETFEIWALITNITNKKVIDIIEVNSKKFEFLINTDKMTRNKQIFNLLWKKNG